MQKALSLKPLMAHCEGLSDADSCGEWKSKVPIDFNLVKDSDKAYWSKYSYSPKILLSLSDARKIFLNSKAALKLLNLTKRDPELITQQEYADILDFKVDESKKNIFAA